MSNIQIVGHYDPKTDAGYVSTKGINTPVKVDISAISSSKPVPVQFNKGFRPWAPIGSALWVGVHVPPVHTLPPSPPCWPAGTTGMIPQDLAIALYNHEPSICTPIGWSAKSNTKGNK